MKDTSQLTEQLQTLINSVQRHLIVISVVLFAGVCAYLMLLTASLLQAEPATEAIDEKAKAVASPTVRKDVVDTMKGLEDRNVQVQTIFEEARENPFTE